MSTVSVIVPVYKALPTLARCVKSVLAQTFADFELILVDDGSPDASGKLCDAFALADERVRTIHQFNAGVSAARNAGLAAAGGQWVVFLDADDALAPCALESALAAVRARPRHLVLWPFAESLPDLAAGTSIEGEAFPPSAAGWLYLDCRLSMPWNKLFERALIEKAPGGPLRFDPAFSLGEDLLFCLDYCRAFFAVGGAGFYKLAAPLTFYDTVENEESLTQRYRPDFCELWSVLFRRLLADCESSFHCPAQDLTAIRHSYLCTLAAGITDLLRRGGDTKRSRRRKARAVLGRQEVRELLLSLKSAGRFSPLATAMRLHSPRLTAWLYRLRQAKPALYGKLEALGQKLTGHPAV